MHTEDASVTIKNLIQSPSPVTQERLKLSPTPDPFEPGTKILNRWFVKQKRHPNTSRVYIAFDSKFQLDVAIKIDETSRTWISREVSILRKLKLRGAAHFCDVYYYHLAPSRNTLSFLAMPLLGMNLDELRSIHGPFSLGTSLLIGRQMLEAIEYLHSVGYIHRDVKPSCFVMGGAGAGAGRGPGPGGHSVVPVHRQVFLVNFNNSKKYASKQGHCPARPNPGFKGTLAFASRSAHEGRELSRRDDLWSLLYSIVSLRVDLPWVEEVDPRSMLYVKETGINRLLQDYLSTTFLEFKRLIMTLSYEADPDYNGLKVVMEKCMRMKEIRGGDLYDWERRATSKHSRRSARVVLKVKGRKVERGTKKKRRIRGSCY